MKRVLGLISMAGLLALAGCAGTGMTVTTPLADVSAGTTVREDGKIGVAGSASKTVDTGLGTKAKVGYSTTGGVILEAVSDTPAATK